MRAWGAGHGGSLSNSSHTRSASVNPPVPSSWRRSIFKSNSVSTIPTMATTNTVPESPASLGLTVSETSFHSIPDTEVASKEEERPQDSPAGERSEASGEVTALNDKLISAINYQTTLDERLAQTKHELEASRARIAHLEAESKAHEEKLLNGELLTKDQVEQQKNRLLDELAEERRQKQQIQQEKQGIEAELENLTASLFEEANNMVAAANKDREAVERKNQQLREQIKDGETIVASQNEQLLELKMLMQHIGPSETASPRVSNAPSSPHLAREDGNIARLLEAMNLSPTSPDTGEISPAPSTTFTHLLKPICRSDVPAYEDFRQLVQTSAKSHAGSRMGSGSYTGLNVIGVGPMNGSNLSNVSAHGSTTSLNAPPKSGSNPTLPGSFSPTETKGPTPLKDTKFFKRIMVEDIEPTLRLDLSTTISWLSRRSITNAFADSTLMVEPIPEASVRLYGKYTSCALCGESRKKGENARTHRMRVNEGEGATKWALCQICLEKVRAVGDLVGYVRMIRDGVVKCNDKAEELEAWDALVRLRERLFWARMAGGVVPSFLPTEKITPVATGAGEMDQVDTPVSIDAQIERAPTPARQASESSNEEASHSQDEAALQLQSGLDEYTTFDNLKNVARLSATPPSTPPRTTKRDSGGSTFPRLSIPKIPDNFWAGQINVLK